MGAQNVSIPDRANWIVGEDRTWWFLVTEDDDATIPPDIDDWMIRWYLRNTPEDPTPTLDIAGEVIVVSAADLPTGEGFEWVQKIIDANLSIKAVQVNVYGEQTEGLAPGNWIHALFRTDEDFRQVLAGGSAVLKSAAVKLGDLA